MIRVDFQFGSHSESFSSPLQTTILRPTAMFSCQCSISRPSEGEGWITDFAAQAHCLAGRHQNHEGNDRHDSAKLYNTTSANAVLKAGQELSSWILNTLPSPLPLSLFSTQRLDPPSRTPHINTLPQEVLEEIFQEYVHGDNTDHFYWRDPLTGPLSRIVTQFGASTTPFTLAHVCAFWRAIVMGNPTLWSKLCAARAEPCDVPLFQYWLSLSAGTLLDIEIIQRTGSEPGEALIDTTAHTLLMLALEHSNRWKRARLGLMGDMEPLFTTAQPLPMSSLRSVDLCIWDWTLEGLQSLAAMLSVSPLLQGVSLISIDQNSPFMSGLAWANIRKIELCDVHLTDLLYLLRLATSLEHLSIMSVNGRRCTSTPPEANTPVHLPSLSTVSLQFYEDAPALLDALTLPSLSSLSLGSGFDVELGTGSGWQSFYNLVQRSGPGCCIQSLSWYDGHLSEEALVGNLKKGSTTVFSDLTHLKIRTPVGIKFIDALTYRSGKDVALFPRLDRLELMHCRVDGNILDEMISSRPQLRRVDILNIYDDEGRKFREVVFNR
ncbi:hypothetical protein NMY22_g17171 [Coprinellus aureogranulatus]|nr:hypothetical protein NMY22_g17171 [Coprinellus aureogranulatus]